ncbi:MAG: hypothetical protein L0H84_01135 [Pseudonocardia sp.]|nr:hypothetical protein [Pseudonocardia sp.]
MTELAPFDPNDYRKRVLAAVEKRGGPDASDPFELYDVPLEAELAGALTDGAVAARIDEVWGFWQRQRDHPKYRVLVGLLVEDHDTRSAELRDPDRRRTVALRVRRQREQRDFARFELLDSAIRRLVDRYGGVPRDKVGGLDEVGALTGLTPAEVAARLRRHRVVDPAAPAPAAEPAIGPERRRQVRALLDEFGRLTDVPAPPTLIALLGLTPASPEPEVRAAAAAWRARARELPPERLRAVVDELMVHVAELIEPGTAAVEAYLDTVVLDVREHLMPRVRAAVLVEDRLVAEDHEHLVEEAVARGLDRRRATDLLAALAAELGTTIEGVDAPAAGGQRRDDRASAPEQPRAPSWEEPLKAARAALRAGHPVAAQRLVADARRYAGSAHGGGAPPNPAGEGEVDAVLAEARVRARAAPAAIDGRRFVEALAHLDHLARTASDLGEPPDAATLHRRAREAVAAADRAVAAAGSGPAGRREAALRAVLADCVDHAGAAAALAGIPVGAPPWVNAARGDGGEVLVLWAPSDTPEVSYRVSRRGPDGAWRVVGRVHDTSIEDGGAPPGVEPPVYAVSAVQDGRSSRETRSDGPSETAVPTAEPEPGAVPAPSGVIAARLADGAVRVSWIAAPGDAGSTEYRVRCRGPEGGPAAGGWRVVGRTRATVIEDGGAPPGAMPVYEVSAVSQGGPRSAEVLAEPG